MMPVGGWAISIPAGMSTSSMAIADCLHAIHAYREGGSDL